MASPKVLSHGWGWLEVEGFERFKDAVLFPGGAREWDWGVTGMRHSPGIGPEEVGPLAEAGATTVILSRGVHQVLQVRPEAVRWLEERGIRVHVLQTDEAIARYNALADKEAVGALIHSTC